MHDARGDRDLPPAVLALRPVGNPLTFGLIGLAIATVVVSGHDFGWYDGERRLVGLIVALAAPPLQATAAVFALLARDSVAATSMAVQAVTWLFVGVVIATTAPGSHSDALGTALFVSGTALLLTARNAARFKLLFGVVVGVTGVRYILSGLGEISAEGWGDAAGVVGLFLAALALLAATAGEIEEETNRTLAVSGRRKRGERAFHPDEADLRGEAAVDPGARDLL